MRLRFAPSPTGYLHVGGARTALFNWLQAKKNGGKFILRIEDTDTERSTQESVDAIFQGMEWLGLAHDEGPFYQTHCFDLYKKYIQQLLDEGKAYKCYCTQEELTAKRELAIAEKRKPKYDGTCRKKAWRKITGLPYVIRFKSATEGETSWVDAIKGKISFPNTELDDLIIQRTDGTPTYNFCVVVDDYTLRITTVVRGDDHVNNTPRQIQLYEALGFPVPQFAHVPMILGADKARLSKRHGATSVMAYRDMGYLPEALLNYLVRLGWSHGDEEIFSVEEMIEKFDIKKVGKSAGVFNTEKLLWLNQHYIKNYGTAKLSSLLLPFMWQRNITLKGIWLDNLPQLTLVANCLKTRSKTLVEMADQAIPFYVAPKVYNEVALGKIDKEVAKVFIKAAVCYFTKDLKHLQSPEHFNEAMVDLLEITGLKMKDIGATLRLALMGKPNTPPLGEVMSILGTKECVARLSNALERW